MFDVDLLRTFVFSVAKGGIDSIAHGINISMFLSSRLRNWPNVKKTKLLVLFESNCLKKLIRSVKEQ